MDVDEFLLAEEVVESVLPAAEDGQDLVDGAAAVEAEAAGFENRGFLGLGDFRDRGGVEGFEPFEIAIRLRDDDGEILIL